MPSVLIPDCLFGASIALSGAALGLSIAAFLTVRRAMGAINDMFKPIGEAVRFERARRDAAKIEEAPLTHVVFERAVSAKDGVTVVESREAFNARVRASNKAPPPPQPQPEVRFKI